MSSIEHSIATAIAFRLAEEFGPAAHQVLDGIFDALTPIEGAALEYDSAFWLRPKQQPPDTPWRRWGFLTGRGTGKTYSISRYINDEVELGRVRYLLVIAQDEQNAIDVQILGPSGLIATAPPWNRPTFEVSSSTLRWPNGAEALVRTPESPGKIRGRDYDLGWATELQSWPAALRDEAWSNVLLSVRLGLARVIWDATPKRRHPILRELLKDAELDPRTYPVVRGTTHENAVNLGPGYVDELQRKYGGTSKGREELLGEMLDDVEGALVKQAWIDRARRPAPGRGGGGHGNAPPYARMVLAIDPAVTGRKSSDTTGIVLGGLGYDGQMYVIADYTAKMTPEAWAAKALDVYTEQGCDLIVVETNKGGEGIAAILRLTAQQRGLQCVTVGKDEKPRHNPRVVSLKERFARGAKEDRAQPAAVAYEAGRISHVEGSDLEALESTLTTWQPAPDAVSPGDLDALAHLANELLDLVLDKPDARTGFQGILAAQRQITAPARPSSVPRADVAAQFKAILASGPNRRRI